ncbi:MAG: ATP-binding protein [Verrucomicrobiales bacterium]
MSFGQFPNNKSVIQLLRRSLEKGRVAHGYLFSGGDFDEMSQIGRTFAKVLNCENPPERAENGHALDSCDECLTCRKIEREIHPDVQWVRPESKLRIITIEQMRDVMQTMHLKPTEAAYKVVVITAADRLNVQAANAFLKTLEEPPERSIIILTSTEPDRMLETILSRCLRRQFASDAAVRLDGDELAWLRSFTELAVQNKTGLLGRYQLLGNLAAHLTATKEKVEADLEERSPLQKHNDVDPKLREKWEVELAAGIEAEYRRTRARQILLLEWWLRDIWIFKNQLSSEMLALPEFQAQTAAVAGRITSEQAVENLRTIEHLQRILNTNVQEALALEVTLLKLRL